MPQALRAVYNKGQLLLLDEVRLLDEQEIQVFILSDTEILRAALGDLLLESETISDDDMDESALLKEIERGFAGQPSLSRSIIRANRKAHESLLFRLHRSG